MFSLKYYFGLAWWILGNFTVLLSRKEIVEMAGVEGVGIDVDALRRSSLGPTVRAQSNN